VGLPNLEWCCRDESSAIEPWEWIVGIVIREVDLARELDVLRNTFNANFRIKGSPERFRWLYFRNPDGPATAWFALDDRTGAIAGCTVVLPRRVRLKQCRRTVLAWNCGDFCIDPAYRTLGVALKLRRIAREAVDAGKTAFLYAHPNDRMLQVHLRVGHAPLGTMVRYAKILRPRRSGAPATAIGRAVLRLTGRDALIRRRHDVEVVDGARTQSDITAIYEGAVHRMGTSVVRDSRYLDWRFLENPVERHTILVTRQAAKPRGYVAFSIRDDVAVVKDWVAIDRDSRDQLFAIMLAHFRDIDVAAVSVTALESHPDLQALRTFGFVRRPETSTAITYAAPTDAVRRSISSRDCWYMTHGDRDV
jgi:hypothetical protein